MSPYLLAFVVSDFAYSELQTGRTLHRIHSRSEAVSRTQFALKNTDLFLKELERYAGFDYELTKVDQAALPDFQSGLFMSLWENGAGLWNVKSIRCLKATKSFGVKSCPEASTPSP